ncbi:MAG: hypothetical protein ABDI20_01820, partial [Candidatus Bipolaricaulaceae bacterium]
MLKEDWSPSLSFAEASFLLPLCCAGPVHAWILFGKEGLDSMGASLSLKLPGELGLILVPVVQFRAAQKQAFLAPTFIYQPPPCVEAYIGLDWNNFAIQGLKLYAWGIRCASRGFTVRYVSMLEPIGLVKEPYLEALFLGWESEGCCGPLKLSLAVYFGTEGVFGIEEVGISCEVGLTVGTVVLGVQAKKGQAQLSWGWK